MGGIAPHSVPTRKMRAHLYRAICGARLSRIFMIRWRAVAPHMAVYPGNTSVPAARIPLLLLRQRGYAAQLATSKWIRATQRVFVLPLVHCWRGVRP